MITEKCKISVFSFHQRVDGQSHALGKAGMPGEQE